MNWNRKQFSYFFPFFPILKWYYYGWRKRENVGGKCCQEIWLTNTSIKNGKSLFWLFFGEKRRNFLAGLFSWFLIPMEPNKRNYIAKEANKNRIYSKHQQLATGLDALVPVAGVSFQNRKNNSIEIQFFLFLNFIYK